MSCGLFLTGTGTDVGKTVVTAGILRHVRRQGVDAVSMKPVQTGAVMEKGKWTAPDLEFHLAAAGLRISEKERDLAAPYCYEPACSPHLAGRLAGRYADIVQIVENAETLGKAHHCVIVEGAGGVMAPIDETRTMLDLMVALGYAVVLVAHRGLGTINHSLLAIRAIRAADLKLVGVVFNETGDVEEDYIRKDNPGAVKSFGNVDVLGNVDYLGAIEPADEDVWGRFEAQMPGLGRILDILR